MKPVTPAVEGKPEVGIRDLGGGGGRKKLKQRKKWREITSSTGKDDPVGSDQGRTSARPHLCGKRNVGFGRVLITMRITLRL